MTRHTPKPNNPSLSDVSLGRVVSETLPFPVFHYPDHYGTFFAFSEQESGPPVLCVCSRSAINNLIRLKEISTEPGNGDARRDTPIDIWSFPYAIAEIIKQPGFKIHDDIRFVAGLCHRCNLISLSLRYCHDAMAMRGTALGVFSTLAGM